ncbi:MAG: Uncharacterized Nudix hydrolase NudL, partial [uncultured Sphingomonadaceae bacterium]
DLARAARRRARAAGGGARPASRRRPGRRGRNRRRPRPCRRARRRGGPAGADPAPHPAARVHAPPRGASRLSRRAGGPGRRRPRRCRAARSRGGGGAAARRGGRDRAGRPLPHRHRLSRHPRGGHHPARPAAVRGGGGGGGDLRSAARLRHRPGEPALRHGDVAGARAPPLPDRLGRPPHLGRDGGDDRQPVTAAAGGI